MHDDDGLIWAAVAAALTIGATTLVQRALARGWASRRGRVPNAWNSSQSPLVEAALYTAASGAAVGVARVVAERSVRTIGSRRPGHGRRS